MSCGNINLVKDGPYAGTVVEGPEYETACMFGSNLGNASSHNTTNLPILVAGGRLRHGRHLAFAEDNAPPLANLFVSFLQHMQLEVDEFSSGTGTMPELDLLNST